ncbi:hypothetical protein Pst134EB_005783 [Puccinia striiformis f. sp. tritici]|nr:hypothetical protein Pst134EB_005783 [Puccinia striiformis f. sp. tritici]
MSAHRTARLRRDEDTDRLVSKTEFPDFGKTEASVGAGGMVPTGQVARWLYYLAIRRAPRLKSPLVSGKLLTSYLLSSNF